MALSNVATTQPSQLNMDLGKVDLVEAPNKVPWVLEHHGTVYVADRAGEFIEILEILRLHDDSWVLLLNKIVGFSVLVMLREQAELTLAAWEKPERLIQS